jgi:uncharacterized protein YcfJ
MIMLENMKQFFSFFLAPILLLVLAGCGKNETAGGLFGTAAGALVGAAVAGRHNQATGAVIGGLVGNIAGREMGKPADREEEKERRIVQQRQTIRQHEKISELESENQLLKKSYDRWCIDCGKQVTILGAQSCPRCGGRLIRYKYCRECGSKFSVDSGYKFCPYCDKVRLDGR